MSNLAKIVSIVVATFVAMPSIASAQMMSHKMGMTKSQMMKNKMMMKKKKMMMMNKKKMMMKKSM